MLQQHKKNGFTLIELLVVVLIISILAIVVFAALNPAQRLAETRDARRGQDLNQILTAVHECIIDDDDNTISDCLGSYTAGDTYEIVNDGISSGCDDVCTGVTSDSHCMQLESSLSAYLVKLPTDPAGPPTDHTNYTISVDSNGLVHLTACEAELQTIEAAR